MRTRTLLGPLLVAGLAAPASVVPPREVRTVRARVQRVEPVDRFLARLDQLGVVVSPN